MELFFFFFFYTKFFFFPSFFTKSVKYLHLSHFTCSLLLEQRSQRGHPVGGPVPAQPAGHVGVRRGDHRVEHGVRSHLLSPTGPATRGIHRPVT